MGGTSASGGPVETAESSKELSNIASACWIIRACISSGVDTGVTEAAIVGVKGGKSGGIGIRGGAGAGAASAGDGDGGGAAGASAGAGAGAAGARAAAGSGVASGWKSSSGASAASGDIGLAKMAGGWRCSSLRLQSSVASVGYWRSRI